MATEIEPMYMPMEHYLEAERLLESADSADYGSAQERYYLDAAKVHALLANAPWREGVNDN